MGWLWNAFRDLRWIVMLRLAAQAVIVGALAVLLVGSGVVTVSAGELPGWLWGALPLSAVMLLIVEIGANGYLHDFTIYRIVSAEKKRADDAEQRASATYATVRDGVIARIRSVSEGKIQIMVNVDGEVVAAAPVKEEADAEA